MTFRIAYLPGDGVGPEVAGAARAISEAAATKFGLTVEFNEYDFGGIAIDRHDDPFPADTKRGCVESDAILLGAVGGPKWDGGMTRPEPSLLALRKDLGLFANLRPVKVFSGQEEKSPLKSDRVQGVDILIVRELTGGVYFGDRTEGEETATDECTYSREEVERVARVAFEAARGRSGRVVSVDKANVMATSRLWRNAVTALHSSEFSDVSLEHELVDAMAMKLIQAPSRFDVIVTENMFGDILSDEASVIAASIGLAPSASLGASKAGLFEPIHGSAPDIAGQDKANPVGAILSAAMMFRMSLDAPEVADAIEKAVDVVIDQGGGTADIGGPDGTKSFAAKVVEAL